MCPSEREEIGYERIVSFIYCTDVDVYKEEVEYL
jgi:hypothetical protein